MRRKADGLGVATIRADPHGFWPLLPFQFPALGAMYLIPPDIVHEILSMDLEGRMGVEPMRRWIHSPGSHTDRHHQPNYNLNTRAPACQVLSQKNQVDITEVTCYAWNVSRTMRSHP